MSTSKRKKPSLPRRKWTRSPAQRVHSSPKGKKGYRRKDSKERLRGEMEDVS